MPFTTSEARGGNTVRLRTLPPTGQGEPPRWPSVAFRTRPARSCRSVRGYEQPPPCLPTGQRTKSLVNPAVATLCFDADRGLRNKRPKSGQPLQRSRRWLRQNRYLPSQRYLGIGLDRWPNEHPYDDFQLPDGRDVPSAFQTDQRKPEPARNQLGHSPCAVLNLDSKPTGKTGLDVGH